MSATTEQPLDLRHYHQVTLPKLLQQGRSDLAYKAASHLPTLGLTTATGSIAFRFAARDGQIAVDEQASDADTCIEIEAGDWRGLIADLDTTPGLLYGGKVKCLHGNAMHFVAWEPVLRALFHGIPIYDPDNVDLRGSLGETCDPARCFRLDDDPQLLRDHFNTLGYLVLHDVFSADEVDAMRTAAKRLHEQAREDDRVSWWGKNRDGESVLCRVLNAHTETGLRNLVDDKRIGQLAQLVPEGLHLSNPDQTDGMTLIYKNPDMVEGLSDLPWHRDCGMGGHARMCPTVIVSIYLFDASDEAGALRFLPGSHRASFGFTDASGPKAPRGVRADARAGSVTLHFSDVMHAAPEPTGSSAPFRQSLLLSFVPDYEHHHGGRHYNDVLLDSGDSGQIRHLKDLTDDMG